MSIKDFVEDLLNEFENTYGNLKNECGCYISETGQWMSPCDIRYIITEVASDYGVEV